MIGKALLAAMLVMTLAATCGAARARGFLAGAGEADTTPPAAGGASGLRADAQFGPSRVACPAAAYPSQGSFALQEPFADLGHSGAWSSMDPFCDANANGRWDGIYADNGRGPASGVHDAIQVRAFAVSDGHHRPVVYASVDQIGLFDFYTEQARSILAHSFHVDADLVVSADHNESSPDSIGLYGSGQTPLGVGLRSGIDEYFMSFLEHQIAQAAAQAVHRLRPAVLFATQSERRLPTGVAGDQLPLLRGISQRISDQFPTSVALPADDRAAAVDPKLGVLQARTRGRRSRPIFTVMSLAAHNQEMGNSGAGLSADWPGAFRRAFDRAHFGMAIFLVADNGSEEDPQTSPAAIPKGSENHSDQPTQYRQVLATGRRFAQLVDTASRRAQRLRPGRVVLTRRQLCVPLENNGFVALAAAGDFGRRQGYSCDSHGNPVAPVPGGGSLPTASTQFRTFVSYADLGPDLQLLDNPGEAFPALMLGSPFGVEDESCGLPNPAVPTWHARALYRFQVGLADDLIGYEIPPWGFASDVPGLFTANVCVQDQHGHRHKLESESVGPTGAGDVADALTGLLTREPDPSARVERGRFVGPHGTLSRWATGAIGVLLARPGTGAVDLRQGYLIGEPGTAGLGRRAVDATGWFMDFDGQPQAAPDLTTRGMMLLDTHGCVAARFYLNVFPSLISASGSSPRVREPRVRPPQSCRIMARGGVPELQPAAAAGAGLRTIRCPGSQHGPRLWITARRPFLRGRARPGSCARLARVTITHAGGPPWLASGTRRWRAGRVPRGAVVQVLDSAGRSARVRVR